MIEAGINAVDVFEILGHSDLKITMRYCHASIENKRQAVEKLGEIYGSSRKKVERFCTDFRRPPSCGRTADNPWHYRETVRAAKTFLEEHPEEAR
jgi:hypothetical protein